MKNEINMKKIRRASFTPNLRSIDEQNRTIEFVASTEKSDRYGDVIRVSGWDTKAYEANPVFLWAHNSRNMPIGKTVKLTIEKSPKPALVHVVQFPTVDECPEGDQVYKLYKAGYLNAVSVGFKPTVKPKAILDEDNNFTGWEFVGQELLELSAVPIPANPEAVARGIETGELTDEMIKEFFLPAQVGNGEQSSVEAKRMSNGLKEVIGRLVQTDKQVEELAANAVNKEDLAEHIALIREMKTCLSTLVAAVKALSEEVATSGSVAEIPPAIEAVRARIDKVAKGEAVADLGPKIEELRALSMKVIAALPNKQDLKDVSVRLDGARDAISAHSAIAAKEAELSRLVASVAELGGRFKIFLEGAARESSVVEVFEAVEQLRAQGEKSATKQEIAEINEKLAVLSAQLLTLGEKIAELTLTIRQQKDDRSAQERMVCPYTDDPIASKGTAWDAAAEMAKQMTPAGWKHMSTVIVGDAANKTSYKLPHHQGSGFKIVPDGVRAALGRLEQTQMPATDRSGARSHLVKHQAKISAQNGAAFDADEFERKLEVLGNAYRAFDESGNKVKADSMAEEIDALVASVQPKEEKDDGNESHTDPLDVFKKK